MKKRKEQYADFGKRLKELRCQRNLTGAHIAGQLGVSPSTYRDWEYGRAVTGQPYPDLARILGVSLNDLFGIETPTPEKNIAEIQHHLESIEGMVRDLRMKLDKNDHGI